MGAPCSQGLQPGLWGDGEGHAGGLPGAEREELMPSQAQSRVDGLDGTMLFFTWPQPHLGSHPACTESVLAATQADRPRCGGMVPTTSRCCLLPVTPGSVGT